jgi:hypothetical protein
MWPLAACNLLEEQVIIQPSAQVPFGYLALNLNPPRHCSFSSLSLLQDPTPGIDAGPVYLGHVALPLHWAPYIQFDH